MNTKGKNILIVDDDIDFLMQAKICIEQAGYKVVTAESQKEGESQIENFKPDLAIFDLMMEKDDSGFILSYKLKKRYPDVPVIIATAVTAETGMIFGINNQENNPWIKADKYLDKNLRPDQLKREITKLLGS
ncbi:MAG: response regulator [Bacteroidota bacterium]